MKSESDAATHAIITAIVYAARRDEASHPHGRVTHSDAAREATWIMMASEQEWRYQTAEARRSGK